MKMKFKKYVNGRKKYKLAKGGKIDIKDVFGSIENFYKTTGITPGESGLKIKTNNIAKIKHPRVAFKIYCSLLPENRINPHVYTFIMKRKRYKELKKMIKRWKKKIGKLAFKELMKSGYVEKSGRLYMVKMLVPEEREESLFGELDIFFYVGFMKGKNIFRAYDDVLDIREKIDPYSKEHLGNTLTHLYKSGVDISDSKNIVIFKKGDYDIRAIGLSPEYFCKVGDGEEVRLGVRKSNNVYAK